MRTATVIARRNGNITIRLPHATIRDDGSVWMRDKPLMDGQAPGGLTKPELTRLVKAHRWADIPARNYARMGTNASGLVVLTDEDERAEARREQEAYLAAHPEVGERDEISAIYARATRIEHSDREDNVDLPIRLRLEADRKSARPSNWGIGL